MQFQLPNGAWITEAGPGETFKIVSTGDGHFAIYSPTYLSYVTISPEQKGPAPGCHPLTIFGPTTDIRKTARFLALGQARPSVLDFVEVSKDASGMSFGGIILLGLRIGHCNLSRCDLTDSNDGLGT